MNDGLNDDLNDQFNGSLADNLKAELEKNLRHESDSVNSHTTGTELEATSDGASAATSTLALDATTEPAIGSTTNAISDTAKAANHTSNITSHASQISARRRLVKLWGQRCLPYLLTLPAFLLVMGFIVYPIGNTFLRSFRDSKTQRFTWDNYRYFFIDPLQRDNFAFTLRIVVATVVLAMVLGYGLALYLHFSPSWVSRWLRSLTVVPRFVPGLVATYSLIMVIRDAGVLNRLSRLWGGNFKPGLMYHESGIILMNLWYNIPFVTLIMLASLSALKPASIEAATDIGAGKLLILTKVVLPNTFKEILIATTFIFMGNVGSFTTPFLIGGNHPKMLGIALFDQFNNYVNYERTAALSVIMFLICSLSASFYIVNNLRQRQ